MTYSKWLAWKYSTFINSGRRAVTWVHAEARYMVLAMAIFFNWPKKGCGIFGAEYRKVVRAVIPRSSQWRMSNTEKIAEPARPTINSAKWILRLLIFHASFFDGCSITGGGKVPVKIIAAHGTRKNKADQGPGKMKVKQKRCLPGH